LTAKTGVTLPGIYKCCSGADVSDADDDHNINGDLNGIASCVRQSRSQAERLTKDKKASKT
jgi:hypothetical protein